MNDVGAVHKYNEHLRCVYVLYFFIPLTETVALGVNVNPSNFCVFCKPLTLSRYDPESDLVRSLMMMLQFLRFKSGSSSDTRPLNSDWTFVLFLLVWNIISESLHFCFRASHLYQTICFGVKPEPGMKEHGITTQSPASAVISPSLRVIQTPFWQCSFPSPMGASVNANSEKNTETEDI